MDRKIIDFGNSNSKPPFSYAVKANGFIFCSGLIPQDFDTGQLVKGDIRSQTRQVLENLRRILEMSGSSLEKVVKTTVFMKDIKKFQEMNEVYREFFPKDPPARSTVEVSALAVDVGIEIESIAIE